MKTSAAIESDAGSVVGTAVKDQKAAGGGYRGGHFKTVLRMLPVALLLAGLAAFFLADMGRFTSFEFLRQNHEALMHWVAGHRVLSVASFSVLYATAVALSLPTATFLTITGGFLFGTVPGAMWVVLAATLGATAVFLAARTAFAEPLHRRAGPTLQKMEAGFQANALSYLLVLRLVPLFPFFLVNLAPAFLGVPLRTYVVATLIGIIPGSLVYASVGSGLGMIFEQGGTPPLGLIFEPRILLPILGLAALALIPVAYRRLRSQQD
jgi:uncharacterized membrane protein YdjX (TVP38/TMEM64 family)